MSADPVTYLDSSAINKLVQPEPESDALRLYLAARPNRATSMVGKVEVLRFAQRYSPAATAAAELILGAMTLIELDSPLAGTASGLPPAVLRSLDAIHVASALSFGDQLAGVVTYDVRMQEAARAAGLNVAAPA